MSKLLAVRKSAKAAQSKRIAKVENTYANLKIEKENVAAGYQRLADKYKKLKAKVNALEREKMEATKMHVAWVREVEQKLAKETHVYAEYRLGGLTQPSRTSRGAESFIRRSWSVLSSLSYQKCSS
jgi:chromosome segregation ATPase